MSDSGARCRFRPPDHGATVVWEVTDYCNLACLHCCTNSGPTRDRAAELSAQAMLRAAAAMVDAGVTEFYFSGGEPFARPDLVDVIASLDPARVEVYCNTNGYFIDSTIAGRLAGTALRRATVSIDGQNPAVHALVRDKHGSFDRAVRAVTVLLAAGVPVRVSHVVHAGNLDHVEAFCTAMVALGVRALVINSVFPAGRAAENMPRLGLDCQQLLALEQAVVGLRERYATQGVDIDHSLGRPSGGDAVAGCPAGRTVFFVAANGDVAGCSWLYKLDPQRFRLGNLAEQPFATVAAGANANLGPVRALATHCPLPLVAAAPVAAS